MLRILCNQNTLGMTTKGGEADFVWTTPAFLRTQTHFQPEQIITGSLMRYGGDRCKA